MAAQSLNEIVNHIIKNRLGCSIGVRQNNVKAGTFSSRNVVKVTKGRITLQDIQFRSGKLAGVDIDICVELIKVRVKKGRIVVEFIGLTYRLSSGLIAAACYGVAASAIVAY